MDIERGNLEILFRKIPYNYIEGNNSFGALIHTYKNINKRLYMRYSPEIFCNASEDERKTIIILCFSKCQIHKTEMQVSSD